MKNNKSNALTLTILTLFGCSESVDTDLTNKINNNPCRDISGDLLVCDFKDKKCSGEEKTFIDITGDVEKSFIDLTQMKLTFGEDCIGLTLKMDNLPKNLTFNQVALADNEDNYTWSAFVDIDNNGKPSKGDLEIGVSNFNFAANKELTGEILKNTQKSLSEIKSMSDDGRVGNQVTAFISATISDNSFYLYLPKSLHPSLETFTTSTQVNFYTQFNNGKKRYYDSYPD